jgi:uncharacterized membrane protein (UPF0182 family)
MRLVLTVVVVLVLALIVLGVAAAVGTELLWYRSVGASGVFTTELRTRVLLFLGGAAVAGAVTAVNLGVAGRDRRLLAVVPGRSGQGSGAGGGPDGGARRSGDRPDGGTGQFDGGGGSGSGQSGSGQPGSGQPARRSGPVPSVVLVPRTAGDADPVRRIAGLVAIAVLTVAFGVAVQGQWQTVLAAVDAQPFGTRDPQFGLDASFYVFTYPLLRWLLTAALVLVGLVLTSTAVAYAANRSLRLVPPRPAATPAAQTHLLVLIGVFVLLRAGSSWLDRYAVMFRQGASSGFDGPSYTSVNADLPASTILAVLAVICAVLFFVSAARRSWVLPGVGLGLLLLSGLLLGVVWPAVVQSFRVQPNQPAYEAPFIARNSTATRTAYGLQDVAQVDYPGRAAIGPQTRAATSANAGGIRLLDPSLVSSTFTQNQQVRSYYSFPTPLSVDRYRVGGRTQDVVVGAREIDLSGIPAGQRTWVNDHTVYTHGYGLVAASATEVAAGGLPSYVAGPIGDAGKPGGALGAYEPRIYFGQQTDRYAIVGAPAGAAPTELDMPADGTGGQSNTTYTGTGGVGIGSAGTRLLFAWHFADRNILLSPRVNDSSRILYDREPATRVRKVAPWLTVDGSVYPTVVDGRVVWVVDGYTTSSTYPGSEQVDLGTETTNSQSGTERALGGRVNYLRNSVKATVDAYDGTVRLYAWDPEDPVLKTWSRVFPGTVLPRSAIPDALLDHLRYPQNLFQVQQGLLGRYHVESAAAFLARTDFWTAPSDPNGGNQRQAPLYLSVTVPGSTRPTFSVTGTFVPQSTSESGPKNLAGYLSVDADARSPGYGKLTLLTASGDTQLPGPSQVDANFKSTFAQTLNLLSGNGSGASVRWGDLVALPVDSGILWVQPVYVSRNTGARFPLLQQVFVAYGTGPTLAQGATLGDALGALFRSPVAPPGTGPASPGPTSPGPASPGPLATGPPGGGADLRAALVAADAALADADAALKAGDFAAYGAAQRRLRDAVDRAIALEGAAGGRPPGATTPASPAPTPRAPTPRAPTPGAPTPGLASPAS